ncbi:MAG: hypothetical protein V2A58_01220 [Planctomycetota bacterium]
MTAKEFLKAVANGESDVVEIILKLLRDTRTPYCLVGGFAVNAYVEPVVSLDLDIVAAADKLDLVCQEAAAHGFKIERFPHSVNLTSSKSDLRIQLQTDDRYQRFIPQATSRSVLGYRMRVACLDDVLTGKLWAYADPARRKSKKQKDLSDIARIIEACPALASTLPDPVRKLLE